MADTVERVVLEISVADKGFAQSVAGARKQYEDFKAAITKAGSLQVVDLERVNRLMRDFAGIPVKARAEEMAAAVNSIGGAARLTAKEQAQVNAVVGEAVAKYRALGEQVPAHLAKIANATQQPTKGISGMTTALGGFARAMVPAFSAVAVVNFAKSVVKTGSDIHDMSTRVGISTDALQRFKYAAELSGASLEDVTKAIGFMNKTLSAGADGTVDILSRVGLEFNAIRGMKPEDAFRAIATAIEGIEDPMLQAETATKLFGRGALEILPAIQAGMIKTGDAATVMSKETVKALDEIGDAFDKFKHFLATGTAELISGRHFVGMWDDWKTVALGAIAAVQGRHDEYVESLARGMMTAKRVADVEARVAEGKRRAQADALEAQRQKLDADEAAESAAKAHAKAVRDLADTFTGAKLNQEMRTFADAVKAAGGATQFHRSQVGPLLDQLNQWKRTVGTLTPELEKLRRELTVIRFGGPDHTDLAKSADAFFAAIPKAEAEIVQLAQTTQVAFSQAFEETLRAIQFDREIKDQLLDAGLAFSEFLKNITVKTPELVNLNQSRFEKALSGIFKNIAGQFPNMLAQAIINGRGLQEAIRATFATNIGAGMADWGKGLVGEKSKFRGFLGDIFGAGGAILGDLIGKGINALIGAFKGKGAKANDIRDVITQQMGGDWRGLSDLIFEGFESAGFGSRLANELDRAYTAFLRGGTPEAVQRAADDMKRILDEIRDRAERIQVGFANVLDRVEQFGGRAPRAVRGLVEEMLTLNGLTDEQRRLLGDLVAPAEWQQVEEVLEGLGSSSERLGENLKKAKQVDFALDLAHKLEFLEDAGADVDGVLFDIRERLSGIVNEAIASKTTLPSTLEPYIRRAQELGLLLGPDGEIRDGIDGIDFADIPDEPIEELKDAILLLKDAILGLGPAAGKAADQINQEFGRVRPPDLTPFGGRRNEGAAPEFHAGTRGMYLTHDTPANLAAGEAVTPRRDVPNLAADIAALLNSRDADTGVTHLTLEADGRVLGSVALPHQIRILDTNDGAGGPSPRASFQKAIRLPVEVR